MIDAIDRANDTAQFTNDLALRQHFSERSSSPGALECQECGAEIPEQRRLKVPDATLCVDCKRAEEQRERMYR